MRTYPVRRVRTGPLPATAHSIVTAGDVLFPFASPDFYPDAMSPAKSASQPALRASRSAFEDWSDPQCR
jgi:hypothetical protein